MIAMHRGDRGAVLVIAAAFMIVAVVMLAVVVDLGALREQKRDVTLSTDAAALAAAAEAVLDGVSEGTHDCAAVFNASGTSIRAVAHDYLVANDRSFGLNDFPCEVVVTGVNAGYVVVGADEVVDFAVGPAIGETSGSVQGVSMASVHVDPGGGVRPIAMCATEESLNEKSAGGSYSVTVDVIAAPSTPDLDGARTLVTPVDIVVEKDHLKKSENACGTDDASGQRGQLQFGAGGNGGQCDKNPKDGSYSDNIANGFYGSMPKQIDQDSGNDFNSVKPCLAQLVNTGERFWVPVYDDYVKAGPDKYYDLEHFLEVELQGYCINGDEYEDPDTYDCEYIIQDAPKKKDQITSEWYRFLVHRVYTPLSFPVDLPKTSDAKTLPPVICAEIDTPEARDACVP